jgi:predicted metal-binding membrane protein
MAAPQTTVAERLIRKDRAIMGVGLVALSILAWGWVLAGAGTGMSTIAMTTWSFPPPLAPGMTATWSAGYWAVMLAMWWVMMIAMMTPSAAPMILLYARVARHAQAKGRLPDGVLPTAIFLAGYLAIWLIFSAVATLAQWFLEQAGLVHQMLMWSTSTTLTALLLIAAGLYQLTPLKAACLEHCRSPVEFLSRGLHEGRLGALRMGVRHGAWCIGCCWALMALLFAGGVMNLVWIAGLAIAVLAEKLAPWGARFASVLGLAMTGTGACLLVPPRL